MTNNNCHTFKAVMPVISFNYYNYVTFLHLRSKEPMRMHKSCISHSRDTTKCMLVNIKWSKESCGQQFKWSKPIFTWLYIIAASWLAICIVNLKSWNVRFSSTKNYHIGRLVKFYFDIYSSYLCFLYSTNIKTQNQNK